MIELTHVTKTFKRAGEFHTVIHNITAQFEQGVFYVLKGPSGSGKSTFLHILAGLEQPTMGSVIIDGNQYDSANTTKILQKTIGLMFQYPYLIPELTVLENVALKGIITNMSQSERSQRGLQLLERVGLSDRAHQSPIVLSGGEQQRIAFLRALFLQPKFLLADEPTAHLDEENSRAMLQLMKEFQQEYSMGFIICSHDPLVARACDVVLELVDGKMIKK